ncbi:MAG: adenylate/guanylate cyclase domain-containing protein [Candidatus Brocadiales bacterium]
MSRHNVLVVDDEQDSLDLLQRTLRRECIVFAAKSGETTLRLLKDNNISMIIADQKMPEMTGTELFQHTLKVCPEVTRIILTGYSDVEDLIDAINTGHVYRYITKPWKPEELKSTVRQVLDRLDLQNENEGLLQELQDQVSKLANSIEKEVRIRKVFERYVPEKVVSEVLERADEHLFTGEKRSVSILSLDIRNFTPFSEKHEPEEVVDVLNKFFTEVSKIIINRDGTVDKFIGDGVLAVFGAPASLDDHALCTVNAAMDIKNSLSGFNDWLKDQMGENMGIGIGINTGEVISGNVGSKEKMEYTVVGGPVNMAFRIQDCTKEKLNSVLISSFTHNEIRDRVKATSWGKKSLKGRAEEMELFEVLEVLDTPDTADVKDASPA